MLGVKTTWPKFVVVMHLWADVGKEGFGRPPPQYHDFVDWFIGKKQ
jgi:hypothetical protein